MYLFSFISSLTDLFFFVKLNLADCIYCFYTPYIIEGGPYNEGVFQKALDIVIGCRYDNIIAHNRFCGCPLQNGHRAF
jgi:hypothetical protein